jgi:hypothetical protein
LILAAPPLVAEHAASEAASTSATIDRVTSFCISVASFCFQPVEMLRLLVRFIPIKLKPNTLLLARTMPTYTIRNPLHVIIATCRIYVYF